MNNVEKPQSKMQMKNARYQHNERLNSEQENELWGRSPENPVNKLSLAERGFTFIISKLHDARVVKQFLAHAK